jgi:hypothetical protein
MCKARFHKIEKIGTEEKDVAEKATTKTKKTKREKRVYRVRNREQRCDDYDYGTSDAELAARLQREEDMAYLRAAAAGFVDSGEEGSAKDEDEDDDDPSLGGFIVIDDDDEEEEDDVEWIPQEHFEIPDVDFEYDGEEDVEALPDSLPPAAATDATHDEPQRGTRRVTVMRIEDEDEDEDDDDSSDYNEEEAQKPKAKRTKKEPSASSSSSSSSTTTDHRGSHRRSCSLDPAFNLEFWV